MTHSAFISVATDPAEDDQPPVKRLSFYWSLEQQRFSCDDIVSEWQGSTQTEPSHDLVHLIIAANGNLPWLPHGERNLVCLAEYNAVLLENLFDKTCNAIVFGTSTAHDTLAEAVEHMNWFVNEHYAPFPTSAQSAFNRFCHNINPFLVAQLFPFYLYIKRFERTHSDYRDAEYQIHFTSADCPEVDELGWLAQWSIYRQLKAAQAAVGTSSDENLSLELKIEQALVKLDKLSSSRAIAPTAHISPTLVAQTVPAQNTPEPNVKGLDPSGLDPSKPNTSELDALKLRLRTVETQLAEINKQLGITS